MIDRFAGDFGFLSNLTACPVRFGDTGQEPLEYRSVERAFQAAKTLDLEAREQIRRSPSPVLARRLGRKVELRPDWDDQRVEVMRGLLAQKFAQESFCSKLIATGSEELVEGNRWHDQFWGNCSCPRHAAVPGQNLLGRLLMDVRRANLSGTLAT